MVRVCGTPLMSTHNICFREEIRFFIWIPHHIWSYAFGLLFTLYIKMGKIYLRTCSRSEDRSWTDAQTDIEFGDFAMFD